MRVNCAVSQKNIGGDYLKDVFTSCNLSPGKHYQEVEQKRDLKRKCSQFKRTTIEAKRKRLSFKRLSTSKNSTAELREGKTYCPQIDTMTVMPEDILQIPPPIPLPLYSPLEHTSATIVYFDLEMASLYSNAEILQIACCTKSASFNQYITPLLPLDQKASEITLLTGNDKGDLLYKGNVVQSVLIKEGLTRLIEWLEPLAPVLLVGHNAKVFDAPRLAYHVSENKLLKRFENSVVGFSDTLGPMKEAYKGKVHRYSQGTLYEYIMKASFNAHNAKDDCEALRDMVEQSSINKSILMGCSFSLHDVYLKLTRKSEEQKNLNSLLPLISGSVITKTVATKIASSGLNSDHLELAFKRRGEKGLELLLGEKDEYGSARGTNRKAVVAKIANFVKSFQLK
ncbi:unnamed protein product [Owenia fusiformis]|uniref:Exonuclease domain-containing protein n=1 Tax=Owenia fusiformis TaxID=6347 RepID=A0A8S4NDV1_OWEFU|nr:unnamed protein product [Owenia fusiformis]